MSTDRIQVSKTVEAAPDKLFELLATPTRHEEFDGAEMLRGVEGVSGKVSGVGEQFVMKMHNDQLGDYKMRNTVTSYEENRSIGWAPEIYPLDGYKDKLGEVQATGHTYTWDLEPAGPGQTKVTQTYDWSGVQDEQFREFFPLVTEEQLTSSIDKAARAVS